MFTMSARKMNAEQTPSVRYIVYLQSIWKKYCSLKLDGCFALRQYWIGFAMMIVGIALDPVDGGITKDYCNLSYLFTTGGMAALVTSVLLMLEMRFGLSSKFVAGVGQNPMLAYTVTNFLIGPVLSLTGILPLLYSLSPGSQFWGVMQGVLITLAMMAVTYAFTKLKLFWRS